MARADLVQAALNAAYETDEAELSPLAQLALDAAEELGPEEAPSPEERRRYGPIEGFGYDAWRGIEQMKGMVQAVGALGA